MVLPREGSHNPGDVVSVRFDLVDIAVVVKELWVCHCLLQVPQVEMSLGREWARKWTEGWRGGGGMESEGGTESRGLTSCFLGVLNFIPQGT